MQRGVHVHAARGRGKELQQVRVGDQAVVLVAQVGPALVQAEGATGRANGAERGKRRGQKNNGYTEIDKLGYRKKNVYTHSPPSQLEDGQRHGNPCTYSHTLRNIQFNEGKSS